MRSLSPTPSSERREPPLSRRRDPSPSIWSYRMHRLWLTPLFHRLLRVGVPMAAMVLAVVWFVSDPIRLEALRERLAELERAFEERPEFMVEMVAIEGADAELAQAVRDAMPVSVPVSSFDLDLDALRAQAAGLDAVAEARLRVRPGGVLEVTVEARQPAVLWRMDETLTLLDAGGHRVANAHHRADWPDLPLIAGEGADAAVEDALVLVAAAAPLKDRLRGLVRMGERRWDVVLDRRQRVQLPEDGAVAALERLIALHEAREVLDRDILRIDLRTPNRPTLQLGPNAVAELARVRLLDAEGP